MKAWVITLEGTKEPRGVVALLSARKSGRAVKEFVEWLYALLYYGPAEHFSLARYRNPATIYEAVFATTNTGVPVDSMMMCGHNPFLVARLAKKVELFDRDGEQPYLEWVNPDRLVCDERTRQVIERVPGATCRASFQLPLTDWHSTRAV
jgi:hypothetical protein